jgi:cytochrome b involved in lipid metabolism
MNSKITLAVVLAVLIIGGVVLLGKGKTTTEKETMSAPTTTTAMAKSYTLANVAGHATETDCWMAIEDKVYDATAFVTKHPGGKAILKGCGKDATILFEQRPDTDKGPHPEQARAQLENLYIGELKK